MRTKPNKTIFCQKREEFSEAGKEVVGYWITEANCCLRHVSDVNSHSDFPAGQNPGGGR